jgi:hypothetical protein
MRRIKVGGWTEETFESYLRCAKILQHLKRPWSEVQTAYLDAYRFDPKRAEPLFKIAEHWYGQQHHALSYMFASRAAELPRPSSTLFVDEDVYTWKAADIAAISGFYLDDAMAKARGRDFAEQCVRAKPNDERLRTNWAFYAPSASELFEGYRSKLINFTPEPPYVANNPSIYYDMGADCWRCIVRTTNYRIVNGQYLTPNDNVIYTRNFMLTLTSELEVTEAVEIIDKTGIERSSYPVHGFEDCRLFKHDGKLCFTATVCDFDLEKAASGPREIVFGELDDDFVIIAAHPLRGPWSDRAQKNWMPISGDDGISQSAQLVYALDSQEAKVLDLQVPPLAPTWHNYPGVATLFDHGRLRGGSQLIRTPDGFLCIVHDVSWTGDHARIYLHRFVLLSGDFKIISMTDPFYFEWKGIEFCAGLAYDGTKLVASFGVEDREAHFGIFDLEAVRAQLRTDYQI